MFRLNIVALLIVIITLSVFFFSSKKHNFASIRKQEKENISNENGKERLDKKTPIIEREASFSSSQPEFFNNKQNSLSLAPKKHAQTEKIEQKLSLSKKSFSQKRARLFNNRDEIIKALFGQASGKKRKFLKEMPFSGFASKLNSLTPEQKETFKYIKEERSLIVNHRIKSLSPQEKGKIISGILKEYDHKFINVLDEKQQQEFVQLLEKSIFQHIDKIDW